MFTAAGMAGRLQRCGGDLPGDHQAVGGGARRHPADSRRRVQRAQTTRPTSGSTPWSWPAAWPGAVLRTVSKSEATGLAEKRRFAKFVGLGGSDKAHPEVGPAAADRLSALHAHRRQELPGIRRPRDGTAEDRHARSGARADDHRREARRAADVVGLIPGSGTSSTRISNSVAIASMSSGPVDAAAFAKPSTIAKIERSPPEAGASSAGIRPPAGPAPPRRSASRP